MFTFLTRMGRLFVVAIVMGATASILGFGILNYSPVANKHNNGGASASAACAVAASAVGQSLTVSGHGFAANTQYLLYTSSPGGGGATTATTDSTGAFTRSIGMAYWAGTYGASIWTTGGGSSRVATCSSVTV